MVAAAQQSSSKEVIDLMAESVKLRGQSAGVLLKIAFGQMGCVGEKADYLISQSPDQELADEGEASEPSPTTVRLAALASAAEEIQHALRSVSSSLQVFGISLETED